MKLIGEKVFSIITDNLQAFSLSDKFWQSMDSAFGTSYNRTIAELLRGKWQKGDFNDLPSIQIVDSTVLSGGKGAYSKKENRIYLSSDLIGNVQTINKVIIEEIGHYVDTQINQVDSPGDEGAIFAALVQGEDLSANVLAELRNEDDKGWLEVNGQKLEVEYNNSTVSLSLTSPSTVTEDGPQNLFYVFNRTGDTTNSLTVNFNVSGSATLNDDYVQRGATSFSTTTGSVTFAAGSRVVILSLDPSSDVVSDGNETVALTLAARAGYALGTSGAVTGTILDNDVAPGTVVRGSIAKSVPYGTRHEYHNDYAFAALKSDGSVVTWGDSSYGGNSSSVSSSLTSGVTQIFSTNTAFAALKSDGSVVTWGDSSYGGNSSSVSSSLTSGVTQIFSTNTAFAALKSDGSVVTWGGSGGNSSSVSSSLTSGVTQIFSTEGAFAALKSDGSVVTWGGSGGDSSSVSSSLTSGVTQIFSTNTAFAALKSDGSVVTWGYSDWGGNSSSVSSSLTSGVTQIFSTDVAFAALKSDGSVVTWGYSSFGGNSSSVSSSLTSGVTQIFSTVIAFAALKSDGSVVTWGHYDYGGNSSSVSSSLTSGVTQIFSAFGAFAALKSDGSVVTWGHSFYGGDSSSVSSSLTSGVTQIFSTFGAFAALKSDGSVVTWGDSDWGGNSSSVSSSLTSGVTQIFSTYYAFAALKSDGSVVTWGNSSNGGNSSSVSSQLTSGVVSFADPFNDDRLVPQSAITLAVNPTGVTEDGTNNLIYTFTRTSPTTNTLTVNYTIGGTANNGSDYNSIGTTITFADGSSTATVTVEPTADNRVEANETVSLTLASGTGYTIGTSGAVTGTITNDDFISLTNQTLNLLENQTATISQSQLSVTTTISPANIRYTITDLPDYGKMLFLGAELGLGDSFTQSAINNNRISYQDGNQDNATDSITLTVTDGVSIFENVIFNVLIIPTITLAVSPNTVTEDGTSNLIYTFTRTGSTTSSLTVTYTIGGTATNGVDYNNIGTTVTFAAGSSTATVIVDPTVDTTPEADETVDLTLATGSGYNIGTSGAVTGIITNDDLPSITLVVSPSTVTEDGTNNLIYTFTRNGITTNTLTVNYTVGGTATNGSDYTNVSTSVTFAAGSSTATVTVDPTADNRVEAHETVSLTLASGNGYTIGTSGAVIGTITNDDFISLTNQTLNLLENQTATISQSQLSVTTTISPANIRYTITDLPDYGKMLFLGAELGLGDSFTQSGVNNNRVSYQHGNHENNTADSITLTVTDGVSILENVIFNMSVTLVDDPPILSKNQSLSVNQGQVATITKEMLAGTDVDTAVSQLVFTINNIPQNGILKKGTLFLDDGDRFTQQDIDNGNISYTQTNKNNLRDSFTFTLSDSANNISGMVFEINSQSNGILAITSTNGTQTEGNSGTKDFTFTVTRSGNTINSSSANWAVSGSGTNQADATDFGGTLPTGTVNFAAGESSKTITVNVSGDTTIEPDEGFTVTLSNPTNATIGTTTGVIGTITNDDTQVTLAVSPTSVAEDGTSNLIYTFTRTGVISNSLTVNYTIGGTATNGSDYANIGTSVTFAAGSSTATVTVDPTADTTVESDETVILTLASGTGYTIGTTTGVIGTITNDDTQVTLAVSPTSVAEDGTSNLIYTFTRTGVISNSLTVNYTIGGTATNGSDYANIGTSVTFAAGSSTATVTVDPTADTTVESDETVILTLASGSGYTIGTTTGVIGTITNDDTQVTLAVSPTSVAEDGTSNLIYTFTRTGVISNSLTVNYTIGGTATNGSDYANIGTSVTFAAGSSTATVTVDPTADTTPEGDETVILTLASGSGYTIGTTSGVTGTITNDDLGNTQQITSTSNRLRATPGANLTVPLLYNTSNSNNTLNGIGIRLHYDSTDLSYQQVTNLFSTNLFGSITNDLDTENFDKDNTTDRYIQLQYFATNGNWPNQTLPLKLGDFGFTTSTNFQETQLNFTSVSVAPGYTLQANPIQVYKQNWNLDVDANGTSDALSDGIMIMRYLFGSFPGDALTRNAIASNATRTSSEIRTYLGEAGTILDIDGDGKVTPLSDGIMAVRYLFGNFPGNALINGAISPNATRNLSQIESYLASISGTSSASSLVPQQTTFLPLFAQSFNTTSSSKQIIDLTTSNSSLTPGTPVSIGVTYNVDSADNTLTGIGIRLHYNSNQISYQSASNLLSTDLFGDVTDNLDEQDLDGDTSTNRYIQIQYADFNGNWPNQNLPVKIGDFAFNTVSSFQQSKVNVTAVDVAPGYTLEARPLTLVGDGQSKVISGTDQGDDINATTGQTTVTPGKGDDIIRVNSASVVIIELPNEGNDTVFSSINYNLASLPQIENLTLSGTEDINGIGNRRDNVITGNSGQNVLTGLQGNDTFVFNLGDSVVGKPDRIGDFQFGKDKIRVNGVLASVLTRAGNSSASTLNSLVDSVFIDANGATSGNQGLGTNSAALVVSTAQGIGGTYLIVNDGVGGFNTATDLVINLTGYSGSLPGLGNIAVGSLFV